MARFPRTCYRLLALALVVPDVVAYLSLKTRAETGFFVLAACLSAEIWQFCWEPGLLCTVRVMTRDFGA